MSRLDELPPDQRAALSLLLRQRKSYAEVATLLGIAERAVHDRAHAALAVLAPRRARELRPSSARRSATTCSASSRASPSACRRARYLSSSEPARSWARRGRRAARAADRRRPARDPGARGERRRPPPRSPLHSVRATSPSAAAASARPAASAQDSSAAHAAELARRRRAAARGDRRRRRRGGRPADGRLGLEQHRAPARARPRKRRAPRPTAGPTIDAAARSRSAEPVTAAARRASCRCSPKAPSARSSSTPSTSARDQGLLLRGLAVQLSHQRASRSARARRWAPATASRAAPLLPSNAGDYRELLLTRETSAHPTHPGPVRAARAVQPA